MRYAIDHKPVYYKAIGWQFNYDPETGKKIDDSYKNAGQVYVSYEYAAAIGELADTIKVVD